MSISALDMIMSILILVVQIVLFILIYLTQKMNKDIMSFMDDLDDSFTASEENAYHKFKDVHYKLKTLQHRIESLEQGVCAEEPVTVRVKFLNDGMKKFDFIGGKSDWIDLRAAEDVTMKAGEYKCIPLGVAVELPKGYEAHIIPRSSTFKNYGIIQANSMGLIDESYCGDNDQWMFPAYAVRDTEIKFNDRICQFRIMKHQPPVKFTQAESLGNPDRGGFGSTGID